MFTVGLFVFFKIYLCIWVLVFTYVCVPCVCIQRLWRPEEGVSYPGIVVIHARELPYSS